MRKDPKRGLDGSFSSLVDHSPKRSMRVDMEGQSLHSPDQRPPPLADCLAVNNAVVAGIMPLARMRFQVSHHGSTAEWIGMQNRASRLAGLMGS